MRIAERRKPLAQLRNCDVRLKNQPSVSDFCLTFFKNRRDRRSAHTGDYDRVHRRFKPFQTIADQKMRAHIQPKQATISVRAF